MAVFSQSKIGNQKSKIAFPVAAFAPRFSRRLVGVPGLEPGTSSLSGMRSNQLSYTPDPIWDFEFPISAIQN